MNIRQIKVDVLLLNGQTGADMARRRPDFFLAGPDFIPAWGPGAWTSPEALWKMKWMDAG